MERPRGAPVRRLLLLLALAIALPLSVVAVVGAWAAAERERGRFEQQLVATAHALALAVDRELALAEAVLATLAASPQLAEGDLFAFDAAARRGVDGRFTVVLFDAAGRSRVNTALPRDERVLAATPQTNRPLLAQVLAQGGPAVSDVFVGASGRHVVAVGRHVEVVGAPAMLAIAIWSYRLGDVLREQALPEGWVASVLDRATHVAARTQAEDRFLGEPAPGPVRDMLGGAGSGVVRNISNLEGLPADIAMARAPRSGFAVTIAAPAPAALAAAWETVRAPAIAVLALLALALVAARLLGTRLLRGIDRLGAPAAPSGLRELDLAADRLRTAERAREEAMRRLADSEARYRIATEAFAGGVYECRPFQNLVLRSAGHLRLVGEEHDEPHRDWWLSRVHPDDLPRLLAAYDRVKRGGAELFEVEYRARHHDGQFRWVWHRSVCARDATGRAERMVGSVIDITAEREAQEAEKMVARELDHRVKNAFALVASIVGLTASRHPEAREFAAELGERLRALAAAHDVVRRGAGGASLHELLRRLAAPHEDLLQEGGVPQAGAGCRRITVSGEDAALSPEAVPHLGLILHEWLTNAAKYGALSVPGGRVRIATRRENGTLSVAWVEEGGPMIEGPPAERGFGSMLAEATAGSRFGGTLDEDWAPGGLRLTLRLAEDRVVPPEAQPETATAGPATLSR